MKLLLDTNAFIWASREPNLLPPHVRKLLSDPYNERYVSIASLWEMQIKADLGKLDLPGTVEQVSKAWMGPLIARLLPIEVSHLNKLSELPKVHRDPFDRILIAQALHEDMKIVSSDSVFRTYSAPVVW